MFSETQNADRSGQAEDAIPAAITDTGCERELNEDRYAVIESPSGIAWLVCDGMGGSTGGELAAQLAIDAIRRDLEKHQPRPAELAMKSAMVEANRVIVLRRQNQAFASMGTTVVAALFEGPKLVIGNIGDSRAYIVREGAIQQLTTDHTYVQQLVEKGELKPEEALAHPQAHILTRCVGAEPGIEVDVRKFWIWDVSEGEPCDYLLLCSDGLYSLVADAEIASIVSQNTPQNACVRLVELAKARGGYDNITISVIPLAGQVRQTQPPGIDEQRLKSTRAKVKGAEPARRTGAARLLLFTLLLTVVAAVVTIMIFLGQRLV